MAEPDSKITPELRARAGDAEEPIDVIVELENRGGEETGVEGLKAAFSASAAPVAERIANLGGEVTGEAWINQTVRARVPAKHVDQIADLDEVSVVDVPRALEAD
jgi:hypothetical protein